MIHLTRHPSWTGQVTLFSLLLLASAEITAEIIQWRPEEGGNGNSYELVTPGYSISWEDAREAAISKGGHLATITSQAEQNFITSRILPGVQSGGPIPFNAWGWWLGALRETSGGPWRWITGEPFSDIAWAAGQFPQPSSPFDPLVWLGIFSYDSVPYGFEWGKWDDVRPDAAWLFHGYVVEYDNGTPPQPKSDREKAAALAKLAVGGVYVHGAKGWDWEISRFVEPSDIGVTGYHWSRPNPSVSRNGIDCSGLVFWSYNKATGAAKYQETWQPGGPPIIPNGNLVQYAGANGQFWHNTVRVDEPGPGDLLFFDWDGDNYMDHVAMYVGCCDPNGNDVIQASGPRDGDPGARWARKDALVTQKRKDGSLAFSGFARINTPQVGLRAIVGSPVDLIVSDPDGFTITPETLIVTESELLREVPGILYYDVIAIGADGSPKSSVTAPVLKTGVYLIKVVRRPESLPTDTFSLHVEAAGSIIVLAQDVQVSEMPPLGYGVQVSADQIDPFVVVSIDIKPGSQRNPINLRSNGLIPVGILAMEGFDPLTVHVPSLRFGPNAAQPSRGLGFEDVNGDGRPDLVVHFSVQDTGIGPDDSLAILTGQTLTGVRVRGADWILSVPSTR